MKLIHFSDAPLSRVLSVEQSNEPHFKPNGLWVSVEGNGDGWKDWCEGEQWNLERFAYANRVQLKNGANILRISSADGIHDLTGRYSSTAARSFTYLMLDWRRVSDEYQGIIIAPYIWECRLSERSRWYYAWDCASGCIWDSDAIEAVTTVNSEAVT